MTRWFNLVVHLAKSLDGGRLQRGFAEGGIIYAAWSSSEMTAAHCPQPLSRSFSLGKSTYNVPCKGNTVNFTVKLLNFIFSGYDIAAALLQILTSLFERNHSCSSCFSKLWDRRHAEAGRKSRRCVRAVSNNISSDQRRQTSLPSPAQLLFHILQPLFIKRWSSCSLVSRGTWLYKTLTASCKVLAFHYKNFSHSSSLRPLVTAAGTLNDAVRNQDQNQQEIFLAGGVAVER